MVRLLLIWFISLATIPSVVIAQADLKSHLATGMLDLNKAVVVAPENLSRRESKAVAMLVEEVRKRTMIRWVQQQTLPKSSDHPIILVGTRDKLRTLLPSNKIVLSAASEAAWPEGYQIVTTADRSLVAVIGNDERGVLFGVGRLLRELRMNRGRIEIPTGFQETSAPETALRGHQLGYRQKTNSERAGLVKLFCLLGRGL